MTGYLHGQLNVETVLDKMYLHITLIKVNKRILTHGCS